MLHQAPQSFLLILALSIAPALFGCSRQGEGERCSPDNADSDCEDNLVCTELRDAEAVTFHRCCPEAGEPSSDERCELAGVVGDGDASDGGAGGMMSSGDEPVGLGEDCSTSDCVAPLACNAVDRCDFQNCVYTSDCVAPLICLPGGTCNYECRDERDCDAGETCSTDLTCVTE